MDCCSSVKMEQWTTGMNTTAAFVQVTIILTIFLLQGLSPAQAVQQIDIYAAVKQLHERSPLHSWLHS